MALLGGMPDLQLRMSRKVAQLTKVIAQLNDKNEDSDADFQEIAEQYEKEIEQILKETAGKVNTFKSKLEDARDEKRLAEIQQELGAKYEEQLKKLRNELDGVRRRTADKEAAIQKAATKRIDTLTAQVQQLQNTVQQLTRQLEEHSRDDKSKELQEQLAAVRREREEAVQALERKYSGLLSEARLKEETLATKAELLASQLKAEASGRHKAEHALADAKAQWALDKGDLQEQFKSMDSSWKSKVEAMVEQVQDAKAAAKQASANEQRSKARVEQLEGALAAAAAEAERLERELQALRQASDAAAAELRQQLNASDAQAKAAASSSSHQCQQLQQALDVAQQHTSELEAQLTGCKVQLDKASQELEAHRGSVASQSQRQQEHVQQLTAKLAELEDSARTAHRQRQEEVKKVHEELRQRLAAAEAQHKEALATADRDAASRAEVARAQAETRLAGAEKRLRQEMGDMKNRLEQDKADTVAALTQQHAQQSETYNRQASGLKLQIAELMQLLADERRKREGLDQERAKLAGQMESAARSASMSRSELEERVRALGASETSLKAQLADAAARLDKASQEQRGSEEALAALRCEVESLQTRLQGLQEDMAAALQKGEAREQQLKREAEEQRDQALQALQQRANLQLKEATAAAEQRHTAELLAARASLSAQGARALAAAEVSAKAAAVQAAAAAEQQAREAAARAAAELDTLRVQHARDLAAERERFAEQQAAHKAELACLRAQLSSQVQGSEKSVRDQMQADMRAALDQQRRLHEEQLEGVRAGMRAAHEEEMRQERGAGEARVAEAKTRHQQHLEAQRKSFEAVAAQAAAARQEAEAVLRAASELEVARLKQAHEQALAALVSSHATELAAVHSQAGQRTLELQSAATSLEHRKAFLEAEVQCVQQQIDELQSVLTMRAAEAEAASVQLKQEHAQEKEQLLKAYREDKAAMLAGHAESMAAMQRAMEDAAARCITLEQQLTHARSQLEAQEQQSCGQDASRITQLEAALLEAEARAGAAEKAADDLVQRMKSELLLREDVYNKHFKNGGAGDKVLNVGSAKHAEAGLMGWMLNRKSLDLPAAPGARPSVSRGGSRELGTPAKKL